MNPKYARFGIATAVIILTLGALAYVGIEDSKSYYVTIKELRSMGSDAYAKNLRVAGNVQPGTIHQNGTHANFVLIENSQLLSVAYKGSEPPPDTFKDNAQALVRGKFGRDGVFQADEIQAKCASKYAPKQQAGGAPVADGQAVPAAQVQPKGY